MKLSTRFVTDNSARFVELKSPELDDPEAQRDPAVAATVSGMLREIEAGGVDAVRRFAARLDSDNSHDFEIDAATLARAGEALTRNFARPSSSVLSAPNSSRASSASTSAISKPSWYPGWSPASATSRWEALARTFRPVAFRLRPVRLCRSGSRR